MSSLSCPQAHRGWSHGDTHASPKFSIKEDIPRLYDDGVGQVIFKRKVPRISHPEIHAIFDAFSFRPFAGLFDHLFEQVNPHYSTTRCFRPVAGRSPYIATDIQYILSAANVAQIDLLSSSLP